MIDGQALKDMIDRDPRAAWDRLVDDYSDLILGVIARYTRDVDRQMDAYLYVLEELQGQDFRRLRRFEQGAGGRACTLATWLKLVVRNLYFDWFRREHGRKSLPKEIQKLSGVEQRAFKLVYWEGYSAQQAFEVLRGQVKQLSFADFIRKLAGVEERLSPINRAKIRRDIERARGPLSLDNDQDGPPLEARADVRVPPTPEEEASVAERRKALWDLIEALPHEDRLLIRLRFFERLTAKQIAAALGVADSVQIYRRIERVCLDLKRQAAERGLDVLLLEGDPAQLADTVEPFGDP